MGCTQLSRRHLLATSGRLQFMRYMLAVGPPMSLITPLNSRVFGKPSDFGQHRFAAAALDHPAFVGRDRAERAAAEAAAHDLDRVLDHLERRNFLPP